MKKYGIITIMNQAFCQLNQSICLYAGYSEKSSYIRGRCSHTLGFCPTVPMITHDLLCACPVRFISKAFHKASASESDLYLVDKILAVNGTVAPNGPQYSFQDTAL